MHRLLKHSVESALCNAGLTNLGRYFHRGRTLVLAYHNIVPHGESTGGDTSLHLPQQSFSEQLDLLSRTHDIVPITELDRQTTNPRPRAAITFDDAYHGALTAGVQELVKRGLPATIFVAPGFVGGATFWWDVLAESGAGLSETLRDHALERLAGQDATIRDWSRAQHLPLQDVGRHQTAASEAELAAAEATGLITFGSHTWSHPNLTRLPPPQLADELTQPLAWLRARYACTIPFISYPYGLSSPSVQGITRTAGYEFGFLIAGGWLQSLTNRYSLPRLNIPAGISLNGFELRTAGFLG